MEQDILAWLSRELEIQRWKNSLTTEAKELIEDIQWVRDWFSGVFDQSSDSD